MTSTTNRTALSPRETAKADLLAEIIERPGRNKMAVITCDGKLTVPAATRANQYRMIDDLIRRGLVENHGDHTAYALHATKAGTAELARWESQ